MISIVRATFAMLFDKVPIAARRIIARASKFLLFVVIALTLVGDIWADNIEPRLIGARRAYRQGNYLSAKDMLMQVKGSLDKLPAQEQIEYWDLRANVDDVSGRFVDAEKAAARHRTLIGQASAAEGGGDVHVESQSLVRWAKIKRELSQLKDACRLYQEALKIPRSDEPAEALWEAETQFELASTLEQFRQFDNAVREFDATSRTAEKALANRSRTKLSADESLRAITLLRRAFSSQDKSGPNRQSEKSLAYLKNALQSEGIKPQNRGSLLIAAAACYQQVGSFQKTGSKEQTANRASERRILEQVLGEIKNRRSSLEPTVEAEATIRLAELSDLMDAPSLRPAQRQSTLYYQRASGLYVQILADAKKPRSADQGAEKSNAESINQNVLEPSIGDQLESLMKLQLIYTRLSNWDAAIQTAEALRVARAKVLAKDDPNYYRTLSSLGSLYAVKARAARAPAVGEVQSATNSEKDIKAAQHYLAEAAEFWRKHEPRSATDLSSTLSYYAEVCRYAGDLRRADELLNEAAPYYTRLDSHDAATERQLAEFYLNWGAVQAAVGHFVLADRNYMSAAALAGRSNGGDVRERRRLLALIYINVAQLEKSQRHLPKAREACEKALAAAKDADFTEDQRIPFKLANASLLIVEAENTAAQANRPHPPGEPSSDSVPIEPSANLARAIELTTEVLQRSPSEPYLSMARHLQALARYRRFERIADPSELRAAEQLWNLIVGTPADVASQTEALQVRALNYLVQIALRDVRDKREEANRLSKSDSADETRISELTKQSIERLEVANEFSRKAEALAKNSIGYPAVRVQALLGRAHVLRAEAQICQAKASLELAPQAAEEVKRAKNAKSDAIEALDNAIHVIESPRAMTVGAEEERAAYFAQYSGVFDLVVDLLVEEKRYVEALERAELRRSRTYQDQLQTSGVDVYATAAKEKVEEAKLAQNRYYEALAKLNDKSNEASRAAILRDLPGLEEAFVRCDKEAKSTSQAALQLRLDQNPSVQPVVEPAAWVHQQIGDDDVALLYYIGADKSYAFACSRKLGVVCVPLTVSLEQATRRSLPMGAAKNGDRADQRPLRAIDVVDLVRDVRYEINQAANEEARRGGGALRGDGDSLQRVRSGKVDASSDSFVTEILLPTSLRQQIAGCGAKHLIVVPDGALHQLPLELLPCDPSRNQYLLDILPPMCYAPSLYIYQKLQHETAKRATPLTLISVADPRYVAAGDFNDLVASDSLSSTGKEYLRSRKLTRLSGTANEAKDVRAAFSTLRQKTRVVSLLDADASEAKLKEQLKDPDVGFLHVAAHGLTSQEHNNLFGALALATPARPTADDDGFLSLYEVYELKLPRCELAVLSACETNCGTDSPLEAGSTLARAFICAGSRRVVCSHWNVSDIATARLVAPFMQRVARDFRDQPSIDYAVALDSAKKSLRNNASTASPCYWAPFVLIGPPTGSSAGGLRTTMATQKN